MCQMGLNRSILKDIHSNYDKYLRYEEWKARKEASIVSKRNGPPIRAPHTRSQAHANPVFAAQAEQNSSVRPIFICALRTVVHSMW